MINFKQITIAKPISCSGVGIHSGKKVNLKMLPAPVNHGIRFMRADLPDKPCISAHFNRVVDTSLATVIGNNGAIVSTIEHLMASFSGLLIDNVLVELDSYEVPIMDGSASVFTSLIKSAGIQEQDSPKQFFVIKEPIEIAQDGKSVGIYPADTFKISYSIEYDHPLIGLQSFSIDIWKDDFEEKIAKARTFGFIQEIEYMKRYGFAKGGSLDNVIVIDKDNILNKDGLRYHDEFIRHKILDCIGDFSLLGMPIIGHIKLIKSGHAFNHAFLCEFFAKKKCWETKTL
ncbi:MAG: UDP-3-O-acyl-N-acetylglucosamine deacetylase [Desulfobacterales bacterium]|nr:UDP-3-O-acyl-N-acetylglucosamine deacetylase [Desulfobacterales bacterium]MBF0396106.1 UDP-3-O-acyl-N-acetylglucosamine deacetylase [Desulfobacterales bacterium]